MFYALERLNVGHHVNFGRFSLASDAVIIHFLRLSNRGMFQLSSQWEQLCDFFLLRSNPLEVGRMINPFHLGLVVEAGHQRGKRYSKRFDLGDDLQRVYR